MLDSPSAQTRIKTGTAGLDDILAGGLPTNRVYLVEGYPGCGKTTLAMQYLMEGQRNGEAGLYITLSESKAELQAVAKSHDWDITGIHIFELPNEENLGIKSQNTFFYTSEVELGETHDAILNEIQKIKPTRVVFDSLSELKLLAQDPMKFRRQILAFKQYFLSQNTTVLMLDDKTAMQDEKHLQSIVHGVIYLEQLAPEYGAEKRRLRILKLRGTSYRGGFHDFVIQKGGLNVFPRLIAAEHGKENDFKVLPSGITELDKLLGTGIEFGTSTLVMGPAGSGKSSLAIQYCINAAKMGKKSAIFAFDEGRSSILKRTEGLGGNILKYLEQGLITIKQIDPAELSPGEFIDHVRKSVDKFGAEVVIIDSLNGYINAMPQERFLVIQMHELLSYLNQMNIATFLISAQHGLLGNQMESVVDVSYLADNVLLTRYFEDSGEVRQAISVVKKRNSYHERSIREVKMSSEGITVGLPLKNFHGILSGIPTMKGNSNNGQS